jgi:hypothetical protein
VAKNIGLQIKTVGFINVQMQKENIPENKDFKTV